LAFNFKFCLWHINIQAAYFFLTSFHQFFNFVPEMPFFILTPADLYKVAYFMMLEPDFITLGGGCLVHGHIFGAAGNLSMSNASILITLSPPQPPQNSALLCSVQVSIVKKGNSVDRLQFLCNACNRY
jgi:hypothetical protein